MEYDLHDKAIGGLLDQLGSCDVSRQREIVDKLDKLLPGSSFKEKQKYLRARSANLDRELNVRHGGFGYYEAGGRKLKLSIPADWNLVDIKQDTEASSFAEKTGIAFRFRETIDRVSAGADNSELMSLAKARLDEEEATPKHISLAEDLLTEAVAARHAVIPPLATVEFSMGVYRSVEVDEKRDAVYFAWKDAEKVVRICFRVIVSDEKFRWEIITDGIGDLRSRMQNGVINRTTDIYERDVYALEWLSAFDEFQLSALYFISAAILRDFWVVEDRSSAFRLGPPRVRTAMSGRTKVDRIVYLPRCKYSRDKVLAAANMDSKIWSVAPHYVRSHFRTLAPEKSASIKQRAIAGLHGVKFPSSGKTWVRAHVTADAKDGGVVRFRSRTASRSLFDVMPINSNRSILSQISWFDFERLCEKLLNDRGCEIIDKVGDGGIDILAINKSGRFVLGQAKHWAEKVGPSVVREMIGTRSKFETGHGVLPLAIILSSSGFTFSAKSDAAAANIELVDVRADTT